MKAWKICQNRARNLRNQKVRTNRSLRFRQVRQNRAMPPIRGVIAEGSADGAVVAADGAMAASVDQREAETVEGIAGRTVAPTA